MHVEVIAEMFLQQLRFFEIELIYPGTLHDNILIYIMKWLDFSLIEVSQRSSKKYVGETLTTSDPWVSIHFKRSLWKRLTVNAAYRSMTIFKQFLKLQFTMTWPNRRKLEEVIQNSGNLFKKIIPFWPISFKLPVVCIFFSDSDRKFNHTIVSEFPQSFIMLTNCSLNTFHPILFHIFCGIKNV